LVDPIVVDLMLVPIGSALLREPVAGAHSPMAFVIACTTEGLRHAQILERRLAARLRTTRYSSD
jgi:hypothetical protein